MNDGREQPIQVTTVAWRYKADTWEAVMPFASRPSAALVDSIAVISDGVKPEVRWIDREGETQRIFRIDAMPVPVSDGMIDQYLSQQSTADFAGSERDWLREAEEIPFPDVLPWFDRLMVDSQGLLWARMFLWKRNQRSRWVVFRSDGKALGVAEAPSDLEILYIGREYVLGLRRDYLGVEYVARHRLRRSGAAS